MHSYYIYHSIYYKYVCINVWEPHVTKFVVCKYEKYK